MPKKPTRKQLEADVLRLEAEVRKAHADTLNSMTERAKAEKQYREANEKIAELEIIRDALIGLCRKLKAALAPGAWTSMLPIIAAGAGLLALTLLGKTT